MNIYLINKSTVLSDVEVSTWVPAFSKFCRQLAQYWPRAATIIHVPKEKEPTEAWKVIIADRSDEAGALGYHDFTPGGRPVSYVFASDDLRYGYSPTITATHEIAEMIADPWISEAFQVTNTDFYAKEICDPCEADEFGYPIHIPPFPPIMVSDFVLPNWFIPGSPQKYDFTGRITAPLQILAGGYMSIFTSGQGWHQVYAQKATHAGRAVIASEHEVKDSPFSRLNRYARDRSVNVSQ